MSKLLGRLSFYAVVALVLLYSVFPFYWAIVTSLRKGSQLFSLDIWPRTATWSNYFEVFSEQPFGQNILNSLIVATGTVMLCLFLGVLSAYALARISFRGRSVILYSVLGVSMFPQIAVLSGLFELIRYLNLYNSHAALISSYMIFTLPFTMWMLTTFMREIPRGLEEAAILDGAGPWRIVTKIFIPILAPAFVTTSLLAFIAAWNEFLFALTFTLSNRARTVPVAIALMSGSSQFELPWGHIMAASVIVTVPLVLLVLLFQRRIVTGLTAGSMKG